MIVKNFKTHLQLPHSQVPWPEQISPPFGGIQVSLEDLQSQADPVHPGVQTQTPHWQVPCVGPEHKSPLFLSHEKLSHSQYFPDKTSSGLGRL